MSGAAVEAVPPSTRPVAVPREQTVGRVVWAAAALYAVVLSAVTWLRFEAFLPESDLAVFAQLTWLLGRLEDPFSSITLRPMLADHWEPALALFAPLRALGIGPVGLLVAQAAILAGTAPLLLALARRLGATGWTAAVVPLLWLVSPVVVRANLWDFHPDGLVAALLVATVWSVVAGRPVLAVLAVVVALGLKEDVGLTFAALGLALAWNGWRRAGLWLAAAAAAWAIILNGLLLPWLWPSTRAHYTERFVGDRGDGLGGVVRFWLVHPVDTLADVITLTNLAILAALVATTAGLCLLGARWLVAAVPAVGLNLLSAYEGQHTLRYQYWLVPVAAFAIAGVAGAATVNAGRGRAIRRLGLACGVVLAALSLVALGRLLDDVRAEWPLRAGRQAIVAAVPADASVAAPLRFLSHLSERHALYTFPVPFVDAVPESEWSPAQVAAVRAQLEYVVFDPTLTRNPEALREVLRLGFTPVLTRGTSTLLRSPSAAR